MRAISLRMLLGVGLVGSVAALVPAAQVYNVGPQKLPTGCTTGQTATYTSTTGLWGCTTAAAGTVTSASVVTANGVSASTATATTTPAHTFTLGAITPTSVTSRVIVSGTAPTVADVGANSCGTTAATIAGNDNAGIVTVGATAGTQCRITMTAVAPTRWHCAATNESTAVLARAVAVTTSTVDLLGAFTAGDVVSYWCVPR